MSERNTFKRYNLLDFLVGCGFVVGGLCGLYRLAETQRWFTWPMLIFDCLFAVITSIGIIIVVAQWRLRATETHRKLKLKRR